MFASSLPRRDFLHIGGLSAFGLGMTDLFGLQAATAGKTKPAKAKSCILIWLDGGPSHLETFDLKPDAPKEVRGPFAAIPTAVPGIQIGDLLPRTAARMKDVAIVRSVTSPLGEHNFGTHYLLTGYKPTPVLEYAYFGSVLTHVRSVGQAFQPDRAGYPHSKSSGKSGQAGNPDVLPGNIAIPNFRVGGAKFSGNGFLPAQTRPFSLGKERSRTGDPAQPGFRVQDLDFYPGLTTTRMARRRDFLNALDAFSRAVEQDSGPGPSTLRPRPSTDPQFEQAYRLIASKTAKEAFDIEAEPVKLRNKYGRKTVGQSCLLARRLVERGVPFVTVNNHGWDTHADVYTRLKEGYTGAKVPVGLIPSLDLALSALIDDLKSRRLLDETLIVVMGEFGRTPKINTAGGRDHWPRVFSVALAGGGIKGGQVVGSSDAVAESPKDRPVTPSDLSATIYTLLGVDPATELHTSDGRPVRVVGDGKVIRELIE
jgi:Protein of unknown function (DUF1501)